MTSFSRPKNVAKNWVQTPHHLREADIFAYDRSFNTLSRCHVVATLDNCRKPSSGKKLPFCLRPCPPSSMPCLPGPGLTFMAGIVVEINFFYQIIQIFKIFKILFFLYFPLQSLLISWHCLFHGCQKWKSLPWLSLCYPVSVSLLSNWFCL